MLNVLGVDLDIDPYASGGAALTATEQRQEISGELANVLGHEGGKRLDLRLTASGIYAAMKKQRIDLPEELVFGTDL
ncbi:MAG TPA: hypothetical protein VK674_07045 [Candidatus Limnocylindria bacterium]|nr:hypothetical protein [Candidatus Limnocylindria bacterium]